MKKLYRILRVWFYGRMWLAKTIQYRVEREKWRKTVISILRKKKKPIRNTEQQSLHKLIVKNFIHKQIRCGGRPIDINFMNDLFPQK